LRGLLAAAFFGAEAYLPLTLTRLHHGGPTEVGIPLTIAAFGWSAASWWQGRRRSTDPLPLLQTGFALVGVCVLTLTVMTASSLSLWVAVPIWTIGGVGMGLAAPTISVLVLRLSPVTEQGANSAALQVADVVGTVAGITTTATLVLVAGTAHLSAALLIADPLLAAVAVGGLLLSRRAVAGTP
jgi:MFS family permease